MFSLIVLQPSKAMKLVLAMSISLGSRNDLIVLIMASAVLLLDWQNLKNVVQYHHLNFQT